ncbi:MAG: undecaprenyldiphospho-muramoylpentapeptide beta-N-acetylglucosaminyltransferase [Xanthobacteraceae bacterium]|nr:undecaprenyldiphospho-muramoylpentapeptide beta-N-acetylglucosaminyltransferase [Xanthobacteraceae bacterium]
MTANNNTAPAAGAALPSVLVAAGGTGGHLFPAEALAAALAKRNVAVALATDSRAARHAGAFAAAGVHVIPSATIRGRNPFSLARTGTLLGLGVLKAWLKLPKIRPLVVVGFGGYPSIPALIAAAARGIPTVIHEQNAVMGRANRLLAPRVRAIATGFAGILNREPALAAKATHTGNPVRPAVIEASSVLYPELDTTGPLQLLVFGGSQGAKVMSDIVPYAIERLEPRLQMRLKVVQQAREEDMARVRETYARMQVAAEVEPFFKDLPARMAASHLVVARSGASTVAELTAIGRPGILVPLPHALDQDQHHNAGVLMNAGGAIRLPQAEFTPDRLAVEIAALAAEPHRLATMAAAAKRAGAIDASDRLADLVLRVAGVIPR